MKHIQKCFLSIITLSVLFFGSTSLFFIPEKVFAEDINSISIQVTPENPKDSENVTITTSSINFDLDGADFVWKINDITQKSGKGLKSFSFKTGALGSVTVITLNIISNDRASVFERFITIKASSVDLIFESPDSYTPPFYKGKKLPAQESLVKVTAMPNAPGFGKTINGKDFIYSWKRNGKNITSVSGFGKQSYSFNMDYMNGDEVIEVSVRTSNGSYSGVGKTTIKAVNPVIKFYEKSQNQINLSKSLKEDSVIKNPTTISSVPYFISAKRRVDKNISYNWKINNESFSSDGNKSEITIGAEKEGQITLDLSIEHATKFFQEAAKRLKINI